MATEMNQCIHCQKKPELQQFTIAQDEIYWAWQCNCKTTPYKRTWTQIAEIWNKDTFQKESKAALEYAKKNTVELAIECVEKFESSLV